MSQSLIGRKVILTLIVSLLVVGFVYLGYAFFNLQKELDQSQISLKAQQTNSKVVEFTRMFITLVLKEEKEVSFESRLKLENAVRALNDQQILNQWQKFIESKNETSAQNEVKNLLELLLNKIKAN